MKKLLKIVLWSLLYLFFLFSLVLLFIFGTTCWQTLLVSQINKQIGKRYALVVNVSGLSGNILHTLHVKDLKLFTTSDYELANIYGFKLDFRLFSLFSQQPIIQCIDMDSVSFSYPGLVDTLVALFKKNPDGKQASLRLDTIGVRNLTVYDSHQPTTRLLSSGMISGSVSMSGDSVYVTADTAHAILESIHEEVSFADVHLMKYKNSLFVEECRLRNKSTVGNISGEIKLGDPASGEFNVRMDNLILSERLKNVDKIFSDSDYIGLQGHITTLNNDIGTDIQFHGKLRGRDVTDGLLIGKIYNKKFDIKTFSFMSGDEIVYGVANGDFNHGVNAQLEVNNLDLLYWGVIQKKTLLNGSVNLSVEGKLNQPNRITSQINFVDGLFDTLRYDRINGIIVYENGLITVPDTLFLVMGQTAFRITGESDVRSNTVDAQASIISSDISPFAGIFGVTALSGSVEAFLEATGELKNPDFRGWLNSKQFGIPHVKFEEAIARFGLVNTGNRHLGDIFIEATNGHSDIIKESIPFASLIVRFEGDTAFVRSFHLVAEGLNLEVQGNVVNMIDINLNKIKATLHGNELIALDPINFSITQDTIQFKDIDFLLNSGRLQVSAEAVKRRLTSAKLNFTNLMLDPLNVFLKGSRGVAGILDGNVEYTEFLGSPKLKADVNIKDANLFGQIYKNIHVDAALDHNRFSVEDITINDMSAGTLTGKGSFACQFPLKNGSPFVSLGDTMNFRFTAKDFLLQTYNPIFLPNIPKEGKITGTVDVQNRMDSPVISYDLRVTDPVFGKIKANELVVKGQYDKTKFNFTDLVATDDVGITRGGGYLPFTISFVPWKFSFDKDSLMDLRFMQHSTALTFLTKYIESVDDISGDFDIALSLMGTARKPVRSGNVIVKNGVVKVSALENPITGIEGSALMSDNKLDIVSLNGYMRKLTSTAKIEKVKDRLKKMTWDVLFPPHVSAEEPILNITGQIDFTEFFKPKFNLKAVGSGLYIRTLLAEQEGILDGVFNIVGKDTIDVVGDVDVTDFIIRNEFRSSEPTLEKVKPGGTITNLNLHVVAPGNLYFRNSQLDVDLSGEIWLIKSSKEPLRLSGTMDVRKGKFFYKVWEFDIVRGSIIFDPIEFNPKFDIEARVDLTSFGTQDSAGTISSGKEEYATVRLTGDLEQPLLEFESTNYSQSDILMFLSGTGGTGIDNSSQDRLSFSALNAFGMYFERQVERSISRYSGLDEFELRTKGNVFSNQPLDKWSFLLGQKIAPNLFITYEYERNFSLTEPNQQFGLEYRLNRNVSVVGDVDQNGLVRINYQYKYHY